MNFLAPWGLLLAAAVAVPLALHLLRRRTGTRIDFPAVRYLLRAEKEHAREVRLRNLLLMMLRVGIVLALALAVARPIGPFPGRGHAPTAIAIVLDNSLSTTIAGSEGPVLARLVSAARATLAETSAADVVTLVTMDGEVVGGTAEAIDQALSRVTAIDGAGDAARAIARAEAAVSASPLPQRQLVLLTDGQANAWRNVSISDSVGSSRSVALFVPSGTPPPNRAVRGLVVEPLHWSPRGNVQATVSGADSASWRVTLDTRSVARGTVMRGAPILARVESNTRGWWAGAFELAPDELRGDDVRHFAVHVGAPPAVAVDANAGAFLRGAVDALADAGRVRRGNAVYIGSAVRARRPALLFAPSDPLDIAAANRALAGAGGIPWRFGVRQTGPAPLRGEGLAGARAESWYELIATPGVERTDTLARVGGSPWVVAGDGYVLVASAADATATDLPIRAAFVPWLDQLLAQRLSAANGVARDLAPGSTATVPTGVDGIESPDGTRREVIAGATITVPWKAGVYFWLRSGARAGALVVNPESAESDLEPLAPDSLAANLLASAVQRSEADLVRETFHSGGRRSLDSTLLVLALILLVAEALVARRGRSSVANPIAAAS